MTNDFEATPRTEVRRHPERGRYERDAAFSILDEALYCHVGFLVDGQPFVIPTIHARDGDRLYLHGSPASRMLRTLKDGVPMCVTVTLLDGLVMARSVFNHSMNYRSVVIVGTATEVDGPDKERAMEVLTHHIAPGRWRDARRPNETEFKGTLMLAMPLDEVSVKIRTGPPEDEDEDYDLEVWAGVIPLGLEAGPPLADPRLAPGIELPPYLEGYRRG
jgi:hypothetical protein